MNTQKCAAAKRGKQDSLLVMYFSQYSDRVDG